jgi:hypothetical protein
MDPPGLSNVSFPSENQGEVNLWQKWRSGDDFFRTVRMEDKRIFRLYADGGGIPGVGLTEGSIDTADVDYLFGNTQHPGTWGTSITAGSLPSFQPVSGLLTVPTQLVIFTLKAKRKTGRDNDGYADNLSFDVTRTNVPEGGTTLLLLCLGLIGLHFAKKKLKR